MPTFNRGRHRMSGPVVVFRKVRNRSSSSLRLPIQVWEKRGSWGSGACAGSHPPIGLGAKRNIFLCVLYDLRVVAIWVIPPWLIGNVGNFQTFSRGFVSAGMLFLV